MCAQPRGRNNCYLFELRVVVDEDEEHKEILRKSDRRVETLKMRFMIIMTRGNLTMIIMF